MLSGMEQTDSLDELLICRLDLGRKVLEPCSIVIFGASGDLTSRKLIPALYQLFVEKQLPTPFRIIGFARREKKDEVWREELKGALAQFSRTKKVDPQQWQAFSSSLFYSQGDFSDPKAYDKLGSLLASFGQEELCRNVLFYLDRKSTRLNSS